MIIIMSYSNRQDRQFPRKWTPKNPSKYDGNPYNIIVRSSWEVRFLNWCDTNPSIIRYSSEEIIIPYISPIDQKKHRYFPDAKIELTDGRIYLVEIKPLCQVHPPKVNPSHKRYLTESMTYMVNQAKWKAANEYCSRRNWKFQIITEVELGLTKKKKQKKV